MVVDPAQVHAFLKTIHLFGRLDDEQLDLLVEHIDSRVVAREDLVYDLSSDALDVYFLYSGKVQQQRSVNEFDSYDGILAPGDFFGLEAISGEPYRLTSAVALEDSIVLSISAEQLEAVSYELPELRYRLNLAVRSYLTLLAADLAWREPGENIYYYARRHMISLFLQLIGPLVAGLIALTAFLIGEIAMRGSMTIPLIVATLAALVAVGWGFWSWLDWRNDFFVITDRRILVFEKVILMFDSRSETPLEAVLAVNQRTTWLGRILAYGDIMVKSFTGTLMMTYLEGPQEVQQMIEYLLLRARSRKTSEEMRAIRRTIRERLHKERPLPPQQPPKPKVEEKELVEPSSMEMSRLQRALANFLHLRVEDRGAITYRKFWLVLLQQAWIPTLILLGLLLLIILRVANVITFFSIPALLMVVFFVGLIVTGWWIYEYWDWTNDIYVITSEQIVDVDKRPLGTETRKAAPIKNILSIESQRLGFWGNIFNYGTVFIKVGDTTFTFDYVYNPLQVQRELFNRFSEVKERERQAQENADRKRMADWLEVYHQVEQEEEDEEGGPVLPPPPPAPFPR